MKHIVTKVIVLTRTNFGEADRIITCITPDNGKIRLLAKGVRKIKSRMAGGIELFSVNDVTFIKGKNEIGTLVSSRLIDNYENIVKDINRTMYAYEILKIVNKITEDGVADEYFNALKVTFESINDVNKDLDVIKVWFNVTLLKINGHSPNVVTDIKGNVLKSDSAFNFSNDDMAFYESNNGNYSKEHIKLLRIALKLNEPSKLFRIEDIGKFSGLLARLTRDMLESQTRI